MKSLTASLQKVIDRWASHHVARVAVFGSGVYGQEWDALLTSAYSELKPRIQLVPLVREADLLAIHGPVTSLNWPLLQQWVARRRSSAVPVIAVGSQLTLDEKGYLISPAGDLSHFQVSLCLPCDPPLPRELWQGVCCALELPHV